MHRCAPALRSSSATAQLTINIYSPIVIVLASPPAITCNSAQEIL